MSETKRGLVVDDELPFFHAIRRVLSRRLPQYAIDVATTPDEAMSKIDASLSWITLDLCLGPSSAGPHRDLRGLNVACAVRGLGLPIVIITGLDDIGRALDLEALGVKQILYKPVTMDALVDALSSVATGPRSSPAASAPSIPEPPRTLPDLHKAKEQQTLELVASALEELGSKRAAARRLGVDRRTILRHAKQLEEMGRLPIRPRRS